MRALFSGILLLAVSFLCAGASFLPADPLELRASDGQMVVADLSPLQSAGSVEGAFRFTALLGRGRWAPSAFLGFRDAARNGKFRIFLFQKTRGGRLVAGYDYVLGGELVFRQIPITGIPRTAAIRVSLEWDALGEFRVTFFGAGQHVVKTELRSLVPFVAVSSATAEFSFALDKVLPISNKASRAKQWGVASVLSARREPGHASFSRTLIY